jgi:Protein of unknown function (DUF2867)
LDFHGAGRGQSSDDGERVVVVDQEGELRGKTMLQISEREFERLPLRAHQFLTGAPLHDVWAIDLPSPRTGIMLDEFLRVASERIYAPTPVVRGLLDLRLLIGRLFAWDRPRTSAQAAPTFSDRLTDADRARSITPAGVREGPGGLFRVVYRFDNEKLVELINRTVHAAALSALVETANSYRFYFAVYVRSVGWWTPLYMAAIDPFRKLIVYPSLLRSVRANWDLTMAALTT